MKRSLVALASAVLLVASTAQAGSTMTVPQQFSTIQAAVAVAQTGDTISIEAGFYRENIAVTTSGVAIIGHKVTIDGGYAGTCLTVHADHVTVAGLTFVNGGPVAGSDAQAGGLDCVGSGINITKCDAQGCADFGIRLTGTGTITDSAISGCLGAGLIVNTPSTSGPLTQVEDVAAYQCGTGLQLTGGPFLVDRDRAVGSAGAGLQIVLPAGGTDGTPLQTTVTHCRCADNAGTGLLVNDELGALGLIEFCTIDTNGIGLDLSSAAPGLMVFNNDVQQNRAGGMFLKTTGVTIQGNRVGRNALVGIVVASANGALDGSNLLVDNKLEQNAGDGIHVTTGRNNIRHNYFKDNIGDGLQVISGVVGNTLTANMVRENGNDGIDNWGQDTLISDNTAKDNTGADLAGVGDGSGTVNPISGNNDVQDGTDLATVQELELDTLH